MSEWMVDKTIERARFHQNIFTCVMILKGDLKGFQENFETFFFKGSVTI